MRDRFNVQSSRFGTQLTPAKTLNLERILKGEIHVIPRRK
jgi:hypothetical protein